jgi:tetratricopeptide (TPR) repeat protein
MPSSCLAGALLVLFSLLGVLGAAGSSFAETHAPTEKAVRNVILISIDTLRPDYLSCYGYPRETTPHIDRIAGEGILFSNVISPVPITLPAHTSMLTGTIPPYHGVHDNLDYRLPPSRVTLAETLKKQGFATAGIVGAFVLNAQFGLDQGFDEYDDRFDRELYTFSTTVSERRAEEVSQHAVRWLKDHRNERFFLFLHYYDPHYAYRAPEPFASAFRDDPYAAEIAYTDHCIGQVIESLKDLELYESSLIVVTGDHGELFGEHGETGHTYFIYQGAIKVPLIFKLPGQNPALTVPDTVGLIDIVPTIRALLGIEPSSQLQGEDRSRLFKKGPSAGSDAAVYSESLTATKYEANSLMALTTKRWKYIQTTRPELYDLAQDPTEARNLIAERPEQARDLQERLRRMLEASFHEDDAALESEVDEETRRNLEALGYITSTNVRENFDFDQSRDDPKDVIGFHATYSRLSELVFRKDYPAAKALCETMIAERPGFLESYRTLAEIAKEEGDATAEVAQLRSLLAIDPRDHKANNNLGLVLADQGELDQAIAHYETAIQVDPEAAEPYHNLALALARSGRLDQAIAHYERALELDPESARTHSELGAILVRRGRPKEAAEQFREALKLDPEAGEAHYELGSILARQGKVHEALRHYTRAVEIDPRNDRAHDGLGLLLAQEGRSDEAAEHFLAALQINPRNAKAHNNAGLILAGQGKTRQAIAHFRKAAALDPELIQARLNLGRSLIQLGNSEEAIQQFRGVLQLDPRNAGAHNGIGLALARQGKLAQAIEQQRRALELNPKLAEAYHDLGTAQLQLGRIGEAVDSWKKSLELRPDWPEVLNNLAWLEATHPDARFRNPREAVELSRRACKLTGYRDISMLDTLAVAYAAAGDFPSAIETVNRALELAESSGQQAFVAEARERLKLFQSGRPYRQSAR